MARTIFFVGLILWSLSAFPDETSAKVEQLDQQIQQLVEMKQGYEAKALRHENQAEYLQFDDQAVLETRRHLQLAEENRAKAELVQEKIDQLKEEKEKLIQDGQGPSENNFYSYRGKNRFILLTIFSCRYCDNTYCEKILKI